MLSKLSRAPESFSLTPYAAHALATLALCMQLVVMENALRVAHEETWLGLVRNSSHAYVIKSRVLDQLNFSFMSTVVALGFHLLAGVVGARGVFLSQG